jgi:hypothetical protein
MAREEEVEENFFNRVFVGENRHKVKNYKVIKMPFGSDF